MKKIYNKPTCDIYSLSGMQEMMLAVSPGESEYPLLDTPSQIRRKSIWSDEIVEIYED